MFCSGCGTELEAGLNYCKRCGSRVGGEQSPAVVGNSSSAIGYVGGFGLLGFVAIIGMMLKSNAVWAGMVWIALFYLIALFGICFLILRQGNAPRNKVDRDRSEGFQPNAPDYLKPRTTAQLTQPASVTENTTRTLDKVPIERE